MGGKSTLLRSTCVAVIMVQIGCYVAASRAVLEPVDAIFTRVGEFVNKVSFRTAV
jgi:DNA mismatch repair protein MSH6